MIMNHSKKLIAVMIYFTIMLAGPARAVIEDVAIPRDDGLVLMGTIFSPDKPGPGIVLLHQCNKDRVSYHRLAEKLMASGFHVLTFDFRGFGESTNATNKDFGSHHETLWPLFAGDVAAAFEFLMDQSGVDTQRIGLLGASCGGTQAVFLAQRNTSVKTVVFLSSSLPWMTDDDRAQFVSNTLSSLLCIASEDDTSTAKRTREIFHGSKHPDSELIMYKGRAHGTPLFEHDPALQGRIVQWFEVHLAD